MDVECGYYRRRERQILVQFAKYRECGFPCNVISGIMKITIRKQPGTKNLTHNKMKLTGLKFNRSAWVSCCRIMSL